MSELLKRINADINQTGTPESSPTLEKPVSEKTDLMTVATEGYIKKQKELTPEKLAWKTSSAQTVNFSMYDKKLEKLQSYGGKFMKYGYNPYINNETFYDEMTSVSDQWKRSFKGAGRLMTIGFADNALFGAFAGKDSHKEYAKTADWYTSSKGGITGFMQNMVMNGGYTVGIMADMIVEEAALAGLTMLTLGGASGATIPGMIAKGTQTAKSLKGAYTMYSNLNKTIKAVNKVDGSISRGRKILNFANPLSNTTNFIKSLKNAETLKDVSKTGKLMMGTGALFRDAKMMHLTWTEANLEGEMMSDEIFEGLVANHKGPLSTDDAKRFKEQAKLAGKWSKFENVLAIGATNKLIFQNTFKAFDDLKGLGKTISGSRFFDIRSAKGVKKAVRKGISGTVERTKMMFSDGFVTGMKRTAKGITSKGGTYLAANFGEGIQEISQEMINAKNKSMYGSETQGTYFDSMLHGLKEQLSGQGAETFLSGFFMGGVISPINFGVRQLTTLKNGGYQYFTNKEKYTTQKNTERDRLEADAKLLNELFLTPGDVFKAGGNSLATQTALDNEMSEAAANDDQHEFHNSKNRSYREHLNAAMRHNMMDEFIDQLGQMKTMDATQFGEAFETAGPNTTKEYRDRIIDKKIRRANEFRDNHEYVHKNIKSPVPLSSIDKNDPNYEAAVIYNDYFEKAKEELIFSKTEFTTNVERKEGIAKEARKNFENHTSGENVFVKDYDVLLHPQTMDRELINLATEIGTSDYEGITAEEKVVLKEKKLKFDALVEFKESLNEMEEISEAISEIKDIPADERTPKEKKELKRLINQEVQASTRVFNRHNKYLKIITPNVKGIAFENMSEESFRLLHDSYKLDGKNKELDILINALSNDNALNEIVQEKTRRNKLFMAQYKRYVRNSLLMSRNKDTVEKGLNSLFSKGLGFNLEHLDNLIEKGIQPPVFYDLETGEKIPRNISIKDKNGKIIGEEPNQTYVTAVEIVEAMYDKILDKPTENLKEEEDVETANKPDNVNKPAEQTSEVEVLQKRLDKKIKRLKQALSEADTVKDKAAAINKYKKNRDNGEKWGATVTSEDAAIFEQAEQELKDQGYEINSLNVGDKLPSTPIDVGIKETAVDAEGVNIEFTVNEITNIDQVEILKTDNEGELILDDKQTQKGKVDVIRRPLTIAEIETKIKFEKQKIQALKKMGNSTSVEEKYIKDAEARIEEIKAKPTQQTSEVDAKKAEPVTDDTSSITKPSENYIPTEMDDVEILADDKVEDYPIFIINSLIEQYTSENENQELDKNIEELNPENLTDRFKRWVQDSLEAETIIKEHNENVKTEIPSNSESLSNEDKEILQQAGYESEQEIDDASKEDIQTALATGKKPKIPEKVEEEVVIVDSVLENLEVFEDWMMKDVADSNDPNAQKYIDTIKELGLELDKVNAEWTIGKMRAQVGGRLVVDVTSNGKTFLMYKSLGKGTNAKTKGIWVPIPGFASNDNSWFIKGLDEGKDPKLTMYGSDTFRAISEDITAQEEALFGTQIPEVVNKGTEEFKEEDKDKDQGIDYRKKRANDLIKYARETTKGREIEGDNFYTDITAVEDVILNNLNEEVDGYLISVDVIQDIFNILKAYENATESGLQQFSGNIDGKIYDLNNADSIEAQKKSKSKRFADMKKLGFTKKDVLRLKESDISNILAKKTTKKEYRESLTRKPNTVAQEVVDYFNSIDTNISTQKELDMIVVEFAKSNEELYEAHPETVNSEITKITNRLAKAKGFSNIKVGSIVEMADGSLMKVDRLLKTKVELINYNSIVQNKTSMSKAEFNDGTKRIVNDFNKDSKSLKSELEKTNVNDLSKILSNFTTGSLLSSEDAPSEQEMREHFKSCK